MNEKVNQLRVLLIIQARMRATRLPGKPLKKVLGRPLLDYLLERVKSVKYQPAIIISTTTRHEDEEIVQFCEERKVAYYRGSEKDVLDRFLQTVKKYEGDVIIRITADCPLIDPAVIDTVLEYYLNHYPKFDYVSNTLTRTFPRGMDVEVFSREALEKSAKEAVAPEYREHVTLFFYRHPELFSVGSVIHGQDLSHHRWTVDTPEDLELITKILENIYPEKRDFTLQDLIQLFEQHPDWSKINEHVKQKEISNHERK